MSALPYAQLLIIEFGGQLTLKIESSLRELGYRSVILNVARAAKWITQHPVKGIILSGGLASVYDEDAPKPPQEIFSLKGPDGNQVPILGICYGMQYIAHHFGGRVEQSVPQYAAAKIERKDSILFSGTPGWQTVWSSHGDSVIGLPADFRTIATYVDTNGIAAIASEQRRIWGVQFHPEAEHTSHGKDIFKNFVEICRCEKDWRPSSMAEEIRERTLEKMGADGEAVIGFSGGVDSSTVGVILASALGKRLHALTIDAGNLRENEIDEIRLHAQAARVNLIVVEASDRFFAALADLSDAQEKRKKGFQPTYSAVFQETARGLGPHVKWMIQGSLAPDMIESGVTGGDEIKAHHNANLNTGHLMQIHPVAHLFKYEIRALARELGLPKSISERHPFPGPGLFIRHIGHPVTRGGIEIVRWADARTREVLVHHGIYKKLSQSVIAYFTQPLVGIKGDKRVYAGSIGIRGVQTIDFMTAEGYAFEPDVQKELCRILGKHPEVVHTAFFPADKPPATTEFE